MIVGNSKNSPRFLSAKTAENLQSLMLQNNISSGTEYHYFDIQFVSGKWYAWYKFDFSSILKSTGKEIA